MKENENRRKHMIQLLKASKTPLSGSFMAEKYGVSRQIIVQDIAIIKAMNYDIISTNKGYVMASRHCVSRVFKMCTEGEDSRAELTSIVDLGGRVIDVFVKHKVYGELRAPFLVTSRRDITEFFRQLESSKSSQLQQVTSNYHYYTVEADSDEILDQIAMELDKKGFTAPFLDYEREDEL